MLEANQPFEKYIEKSAKKLESEILGVILEINLGCFGGFDSSVFSNCYTNSKVRLLEKFKAEISAIKENLNKQEISQEEANTQLKILIEKINLITKFWDRLEAVELKEGKKLFSNSLTNLCKVTTKEMKSERVERNKFLLISSEKEYEKPGEENYLIVQEMKKNVKEASGMTIRSFLEGVVNSKINLEEIFMFDDFTDEELKKEIEDSKNSTFYAKSKIDFDVAKKIFDSTPSLYPKNLEEITGRKFAKNLNLKNQDFKLIKNIIDDEVAEPRDGKIVLKENDETVDLKNKVLKTDPSTSGEGIFFYQKEGEEPKIPNSFNENNFLEKVQGKSWTIEDFVHGPRMLLPLKLEEQEDGSSKCLYGPVTEYVADIRFGFYFDPNKSEDEQLQTISSYGRFNYPGKRSNIAQGGGICDVKIVKDSEYENTRVEMLKMLFGLNSNDGKFFHDSMQSELDKENFTYKNKPVPFATLPFIFSESAYMELKKTALEIAKKMQQQRPESDRKKPFMFALDAFANPSPNIYQS